MNKVLFNKQIVSDVNITAARRDKQITEILREYKEEELFDQILHLCICRGHALERIKTLVDNNLVN